MTVNPDDFEYSFSVAITRDDNGINYNLVSDMFEVTKYSNDVSFDSSNQSSC